MNRRDPFKRVWLLLGLLTTSPAWAEEGFFDSDGVKIRYTEEGAGPPVILIHGYRATGDLNWRIPGVVGLLTDKYRVVTIDNRGHGKSGKPRDVDQYGAKMAQDVIRLMDHLKIQRAHLVGYSMGGMITFKILATHPDRVSSALIGGMGWMDLPRSGPIRESLEKRRDLEPLQACAIGFANLGISREELAAIKTPTIVVIGSDDGLLARRVEPMRKVRPDVPVVLIPGATHLTCIFRPEFRNAIKQHLDKQTADQCQGKGPSSE